MQLLTMIYQNLQILIAVCYCTCTNKRQNKPIVSVLMYNHRKLMRRDPCFSSWRKPFTCRWSGLERVTSATNIYRASDSVFYDRCEEHFNNFSTFVDWKGYSWHHQCQWRSFIFKTQFNFMHYYLWVDQMLQTNYRKTNEYR